MTKTDSLMFKGIAILFMLWHHLFWSDYYNHYYTAIGLKVFGKSIELQSANVIDPVPFFLFLSGYGLYKLYCSHQGSTLSLAVLWANVKRVLRLYIHYWITLAVFLIVGACMFGTSKYPGSMSVLLGNITGISGFFDFYNPDVWFLFPYAQMVILSGVFYLFVSRCHWLVALLTAIALHILQFDYWYAQVYAVTYHIKPILLPFLLGMISAKAIDFGKLRTFFRSRALLGYALVLAYCVGFGYAFLRLNAGHLQSFSAAVFIILCAGLPVPGVVSRVLCAMGRRSTSMWFIHSWFCHILFQPFIYSFKYSLLIFAVLVIISYLCSIPTDYVNARILRLLHLAKNKA